jgi:pSer/pThr/pTyr-binding forkhead associated (FHA) protein
MVCPNCGTENRPGELFCTHCGALLASTNEPDADEQPETLGRYYLIPSSGGDLVELFDVATVGRMHTCDVSVQDKSVSREHARFRRVTQGYLLEDLDSTNGTLVNGGRISEPTLLNDGDLLTFGTVDFRFSAPEDLESAAAEENYRGTAIDVSVYDRPEAQEPSIGEVRPGFPNEGAASLTTASPPMQAEEAPSPAFRAQSDRQPRNGSGAEAAGLADEVVATAAHLSDLVQRLTDAVSSPQEQVSLEAPAPPELASVRDIVAAAPAAAATPEEVEGMRVVLDGLASNPKDFDLLMQVREMSPQIARTLAQYAQLQALIEAVRDTLGARSPG